MDERTFGELTIRIDRLICVGFGDCIEASPEAFEFDDEGIAVFRESASGVSPEELITSCRSCPVDAFTVLDASGDQLVP
jgi:ferredoxin